MIETRMEPHRLLSGLQEIESGMGRTRNGPGPAPRNIDLDLLLYGNRVIRENGLIIPHPRMADRRFVLEPLSEIAPDLRMPFSDKTVADAAGTLKDRCPEQRIARIGNLEEFPAYKAADGTKVLP